MCSVFSGDMLIKVPCHGLKMTLTDILESSAPETEKVIVFTQLVTSLKIAVSF